MRATAHHVIDASLPLKVVANNMTCGLAAIHQTGRRP
jgi:hypothetical protein